MPFLLYVFFFFLKPVFQSYELQGLWREEIEQIPMSKINLSFNENIPPKTFEYIEIYVNTFVYRHIHAHNNSAQNM